MKMDQDNNMVPPVEERSVSTGNEDAFDFKNLKNCLPTTIELERSRTLRQIHMGLRILHMDMRKLTRPSSPSTVLKKTSVYQGSDDLANSSTSQETKENAFAKICRDIERLAHEGVKRTACELPGKQKNPRLSSPLVSGRSHLNSQKSIESKRIALRRDISLRWETDKLMKECSSRNLSVEEIDELGRKHSLQRTNQLSLSEEEQILCKKKVLKKIRRCFNLIQKAASIFLGSAGLGNSSTSPETEEIAFVKTCEGLERLTLEAVKSKACELPGKQKNPRLSSPLISGRSHLNLQESIESKRIALYRDISLHWETEDCSSRNLPVEEIDELERKSSLQRTNQLRLSKEERILRKKKMLKEIQRISDRMRLVLYENRLQRTKVPKFSFK